MRARCSRIGVSILDAFARSVRNASLRRGHSRTGGHIGTNTVRRRLIALVAPIRAAGKHLYFEEAFLQGCLKTPHQVGKAFEIVYQRFSLAYSTEKIDCRFEPNDVVLGIRKLCRVDAARRIGVTADGLGDYLRVVVSGYCGCRRLHNRAALP